MQRREFIVLLGTLGYAELASRIGLQTAPVSPMADVTLRISPVEIEVEPQRVIKTTGYNGSAPGPILRLRAGQPVTVEVLNDTKISEIVHWHGLFVPSEVDGSEEEGTPSVPLGGVRRYSFIPRPSDPLVTTDSWPWCNTRTGKFATDRTCIPTRPTAKKRALH